MTDSWTLGDLVEEAKTRLEALPAPKNGQVRAVPDERTIRYYAAQGLLDRPAAMRGRTALYNRRHLAQIVAIKRMQSAGHSLADIQGMWPTIDDTTLSRISGVLLAEGTKRGRGDFWKQPPEATPSRPSGESTLSGPRESTPSGPSGIAPYEYAKPPKGMPLLARAEPRPLPAKPAELRVEIAPGVSIAIALPAERSIIISPADVHAVRAAAASLVTELANRGLIARGTGTLEEEP